MLLSNIACKLLSVKITVRKEKIVLRKEEINWYVGKELVQETDMFTNVTFILMIFSNISDCTSEEVPVCGQ